MENNNIYSITSVTITIVLPKIPTCASFILFTCLLYPCMYLIVLTKLKMKYFQSIYIKESTIYITNDIIVLRNQICAL